MFVLSELGSQEHAWYRKGLPSNVIKMNEECLQLKPHNHPGYQTIPVRMVLRHCP